MTYPSLGSEILLLQKFITQQLSDGLVSLEVDEECMRNLTVTITPTHGIYRAKPVAFNVNMSCFYSFDFFAWPVETLHHPNLERQICVDDFGPYRGHITLVNVVEYLVHFLHYPDFASSCISQDVDSNKTINSFLRDNHLIKEDEEYPYYSDENLRKNFFPSEEWGVFSLHSLCNGTASRMRLFQPVSEQWRFWSMVQLMQSPDSVDYVYFERGIPTHCPSLSTSQIARGSTPFNCNEMHYSSATLSTELHSDLITCCGFRRQYIDSKQRPQWRDLKGNSIESGSMFSTDSRAKLITAVDFEFENATLDMKSFRDEYSRLVRSSWPYSLAPGSHLHATVLKLIECRDGYSNCKRASSCVLFRDLLRGIGEKRNVRLVLIDPTLSEECEISILTWLYALTLFAFITITIWCFFN